ncbi:MAG: purine-nucleoside phosphorylase [Clostridia bacterium]|nr:MAG: purine-nucleoside phosphorylase [Clostridia bacterium]
MGECLAETATYLAPRLGISPEIGIILGSGLGLLAEAVEGAVRIPYGDIPHFPHPTVAGHAGNLVAGLLAGQPVLVWQGRFHYYEGHGLEQVTYPVRVMQKLGVRRLVVTNAAGAVNPLFQPGETMIITDHLNLMGHNPLRGPNLEELGPRFPDLAAAYDPRLRELARQAAAEFGLAVREGIYAALPGPSYETPAEIRMLQRLGADAVGMSTVPEVIVARHGGQRVLGLSCITNQAAGVAGHAVSHAEVVEVASRASRDLARLIKGVLAAV